MIIDPLSFIVGLFAGAALVSLGSWSANTHRRLLTRDRVKRRAALYGIDKETGVGAAGGGPGPDE